MASAKYWPRTVRSDSDADADSDADGQTMPPALPLHSMIVTEFLLPLWGAYGVCSFFLSLFLSLLSSGFLRGGHVTIIITTSCRYQDSVLFFKSAQIV